MPSPDPSSSDRESIWRDGWEAGFAAAGRPTIGHYQRARPNPRHPDPQHESRRHLLAEAHALLHALNRGDRLDALIPRLRRLLATAHGDPSPLLSPCDGPATFSEAPAAPPRTDHPSPARQATTGSQAPF